MVSETATITTKEREFNSFRILTCLFIHLPRYKLLVDSQAFSDWREIATTSRAKVGDCNAAIGQNRGQSELLPIDAEYT